MTAPRRYRAALRAYPGTYRRSRGPERLATLADGDDERGGPSNREAAVLAYRGLLMRARLTLEPEGLLVAAAALVLYALARSSNWAVHDMAVRLPDGQSLMLGDGPGRWSSVALGVIAFTAIAAGPFRATESPRRRALAALLAVPFVLGPLLTPDFIRTVGIPTGAETIASRWVTFPDCVVAAGGTWATLRVLARPGARARIRALGAALLVLTAVALFQTLDRPTVEFDYADGALADLALAPFIAAAGLLLASAAVWRTQ